MHPYNHKEIEKKWQAQWKKEGIYKISDSIKGKENYYTLVEFPYPSGNLHVGHWYAFAVPDVFARYKRMRGHNVLFPIGFDSFGLPAENAAIQRGVNPREWTEKNIREMTKQLESMGAMFDWSRKVVASDPSYYRWTQWLFLQLYKNGLAYQKEAEVNWDPVDKTVLANEQVLSDGTAERSGAVVEKRNLKQWFLKITDYAEELLSGLDGLNWPEEIKRSQRAWIGKSEGAEISFQVSVSNFHGEIKVFTTRPDTLFGATYLVLAPEHELIETLKGSIQNWDEVFQYTGIAKKKSELDRQKEDREKTGVELKGVKAVNPANQEEIPIFVADYVLSGYGTGAIMAVPAHDRRDFEFAKTFNLPIRQVIRKTGSKIRSYVMGISDISPFEKIGVVVEEREGENFKVTIPEEKEAEYEKLIWEHMQSGFWNEYIGNETVFLFKMKDGSQKRIILSSETDAEINKLAGQLVNEIDKRPVGLWLAANAWYTGIVSHSEPGTLVNSGKFNGLSSEKAKDKITKFVGGKKKTTYRLRDWLISRQRYWGCPIPIAYDPDGKAHPIPDKHLPWLLPEDVDFTPTGESPLARSKELKERTEKIFGKGWTTETDTMDTFVDSSWYFLRYTDPENEKEFASAKRLKAWMPVQRYSGGAEHTTMHVLYSRFFHRALFRLGLVNEQEPYLERFNRGLILGTDGQKMSKRWGNVVNPDEHVERVGADAVRMYLCFIGPYNETGSYPWNTNGLVGVRRFLEKVIGIFNNVSEKSTTGKDIEVELHRTIKKVGEDIESFKFNTAISQMMILVNAIKEGGISKKDTGIFLQLLAPFAPHLSEELWHTLGNTESIHCEPWPEYDEAKLVSDTVSIAVQINGKTRGLIEVLPDSEEDIVVNAIKKDKRLPSFLKGREIQRVVYVKNKLINLVVS